MKCNLCPRECGIDRDKGEKGACGMPSEIYVSRVALHMWEEPCISGEEGSGTVFFSGCPLGCIYCQNYEISRYKGVITGKEYSLKELSEAFLYLQSLGANNINLVTPTHYTDKIITAVINARENGLNIPIVYNCSGYEKVETLKTLEGIVDIYLTDFKYMDNKLSLDYSKASDYTIYAKNALDEMVRQQPEIEIDEKGIMKKGVIVRNLLLPGYVKNSKAVVKYVYETYGETVCLSVMSQYTPLENVKDMTNLNRKVTKREYKRLVDYIIELGVKNAFIQEGDVSKESFIPSFT